MSRSARIERRTGETDISLSLALGATGDGRRQTGVGFFDHMLDLLARHGHLDLEVSASGDLATGSHTPSKTPASSFGQALDAALGDRAGITRYGHAVVPHGRGARPARSNLGRAHCVFTGRPATGDIAGFEHELTEEFFRRSGPRARMTLQLEIEAAPTSTT
jgi:imidazoleglycerol-phosphate dehydratase